MRKQIEKLNGELDDKDAELFEVKDRNRTRTIVIQKFQDAQQELFTALQHSQTIAEKLTKDNARLRAVIAELQVAKDGDASTEADTTAA